MDYRRTLINYASVVLLLYSFNASASLLSIFSALEIIPKKDSAFFSTGKTPRTIDSIIVLPRPKPKPKFPLPLGYDHSLDPLALTYYRAAVKRYGKGLDTGQAFRYLRIFREGMSVWLPDGIGSLTKKQRKFLTHRATYGHPPNRFFSSMFEEKYNLYVKSLTDSADYMIPARIFRIKVVKPLTLTERPAHGEDMQKARYTKTSRPSKNINKKSVI